jgi:hypothetical protein
MYAVLLSLMLRHRAECMVSNPSFPTFASEAFLPTSRLANTVQRYTQEVS